MGIFGAGIAVRQPRNLLSGAPSQTSEEETRRGEVTVANWTSSGHLRVATQL